MQDPTRTKLAELVEEYGESLYVDAQRCRSLLLDTIGNSRFANVLSTVVGTGIINELLKQDSSLPFVAQARALARRLYDESGMSEDLALWSIESWAFALGIIESKDLMTDISQTNGYGSGAKASNLKSVAKQAFDRSQSLVDQDMILEAEQFARQAVEIEPDNAEYLDYLARVLGIGLNRWEEAEQFARRAVKIEPGYAEYQHHLARVLGSLDKFEEAERFARQAVEIEPDNDEYLDYLARVLGIGLNRWEEAEQFARRAVEIKPDNDEYLDYLARVLTDLGRLVEAEPFVRRAVEVEPDNAKYLDYLAWLLGNLGRWAEAEQFARRAVEIEPDNERYIANLDLVRVKMNSSTVATGGDCFVATACFGNSEAPEVRLLRAFRDSVLLRSWIGRAFVRWYYVFGPALADRIIYRPTIKLIVKNLIIKPFAFVAGIILKNQ